MNLSENFTLAEFCTSQVEVRLGRDIEPTPEQISNAGILCHTVLEPARARLGRPIFILSGIRPEWVNTAIGGAANSAHIPGRAADIRVPGMASAVLGRWFRHQGLPVDKCIIEFPESRSGGWVHVQVAKPGNLPRAQYFVAQVVNGRTVYTGLDV